MKIPKVSVGAALTVTAGLLPLVYMTVYFVLTGSGFSNDIKAFVVGTIIGSVPAGIMGYWLGGTHEPKDAAPADPK